MKKCGNCKFWGDGEWTGFARCFRHPPQVVNIKSHGGYVRIGVQPETCGSDVCGEWRARENWFVKWLATGKRLWRFVR